MNEESRAVTEGDPHSGRRDWRALEAALVAAGLVLAVGLRSLEPAWRAGAGLTVLGLLSALAYLVGWTVRQRARRRVPFHALLLTMVVSQPVLLTLWALDLSASRIVLAGELTVLFVGILVAGSRPGPLRLTVATAFFGLSALPVVAALVAPESGASDGTDEERRYLFTSYHDLSVTRHEVLPDEVQDGGALALLPDGRLLLMSGSGAARLVELSDGGNGIRATPLELGLPMDVSAYREAGRFQPEFYRAFDALYHDGRLYVTHVHWDRERDCFALRLVESSFDGSRVGTWKTRFETRPCVPLPHVYNTSGGRLALLDDSSLLLAVGTFGIDLVAAEDPTYSGWRDESDYGKILLFDRTTWEDRVLSKGHRNPEGLLVTGDQIWSTEHGPHGGDELNLIEEGLDYGWPYVSYGTDYGRKTLEQGDVPGDHSGFTRPVYAWTPSIGISNLIRVAGPMFPLWDGDLLVASLSGLGNGMAVFRVRLREGRAVSSERMEMGHRVRDLVQLPGGHLALWDGDGGVIIIQPADHVFSQCATCHKVRNAQHAIGPDLYGVVGRPVARHDNYDYSKAMEELGGRWTSERLDRFLQDPQAAVPGTSMEHDGIDDPLERAEIIKYLSEVSAGRPQRLIR